MFVERRPAFCTCCISSPPLLLSHRYASSTDTAGMWVNFHNTHTHTTVQEGSRGECVVLAVDMGIQLGACTVHSQHFPSTRRVNKVPLPLIDSSTFPAQAPRLCRFSLGYMGLKATAEQFPQSILARSAGANLRFRPVRGPNVFTLAQR